MSGARRVSWGWLLVAATCVVVSCRSYHHLCDEPTCGGGEAGAGGERASAGAAGAVASTAECQYDVECTNGSICDGAEHCVQGICEHGVALVCEHGASCVESGPERCVYESPSQWLLIASHERLRGLPVAELGKRDLVTLLNRPRTAPLAGFERLLWSPDGKVLVARSLEGDSVYSLELLRFGAGLPGPPQLLAEVPAQGYFEAPAFSFDSKRALIVDHHSGTYLVDLAEAPAPTRLVAPLDAVRQASFCGDSSSWVQQLLPASRWALATLGKEEIATRDLGPASPRFSRGGSLLAFDLIDERQAIAGVELRGCSGSDWSAYFPHTSGAVFSDDSKLLLLQSAAGGLRVMSLADPQAPFELWSEPLAKPADGATFLPGEQRLLFSYAAAEESPTLHLVDLETGAESRAVSLGLPGSAEPVATGALAMLAWSNGAAGEPRHLLWQSLEPSAPPIVVLSDPTPKDTKVFAFAPDASAVLLARRSPEGASTTFSVLRFDVERAELAAPDPLTTFPAATSVVWAADGSGMIVTTQNGSFASNVYWLPWSNGGFLEPTLLASDSVVLTLQPAP